MQKRPNKCCHPNCFECPYLDCQWDGFDIDDLRTFEEYPVDYKTQMARDRANRYAAKNREKIRKASLDWYYAHHEEQKARSRKWASENKDRIAAAKRKRWAENPEYYRQKQREYRARKKAEKEALVR